MSCPSAAECAGLRRAGCEATACDQGPSQDHSKLAAGPHASLLPLARPSTLSTRGTARPAPRTPACRSVPSTAATPSIKVTASCSSTVGGMSSFFSGRTTSRSARGMDRGRMGGRWGGGWVGEWVGGRAGWRWVAWGSNAQEQPARIRWAGENTCKIPNALMHNVPASRALNLLAPWPSLEMSDVQIACADRLRSRTANAHI